MFPSRQMAIRSSSPNIQVDYFRDSEIREMATRIQHHGTRIRKDRQRYFLLFKFLLRTGARISEALTVTPRDIDLGTNTISIITLKKKSARVPRRTINIHPDLRDTYMQYLLESRIDPLSTERLFPMTRQAVDKFFRSICEPDIKFHAHKFRHTFAVQAVRAGVPLNVLQKWLGHSSIFTTSIYTQITGVDTAGYMERIS